MAQNKSMEYKIYFSPSKNNVISFKKTKIVSDDGRRRFHSEKLPNDSFVPIWMMRFDFSWMKRVTSEIEYQNFKWKQMRGLDKTAAFHCGSPNIRKSKVFSMSNSQKI